MNQRVDVLCRNYARSKHKGKMSWLEKVNSYPVFTWNFPRTCLGNTYVREREIDVTTDSRTTVVQRDC